MFVQLIATLPLGTYSKPLPFKLWVRFCLSHPSFPPHFFTNRSRFDSINSLFSSYCGSRKNGTRITENLSGLGALGRGSRSTVSMARFKCFLPMYPLGHKVSETNSIGTTRGACTEDESKRLPYRQVWRPRAFALEAIAYILNYSS